jgi:hypothetical protein
MRNHRGAGAASSNSKQVQGSDRKSMKMHQSSTNGSMTKANALRLRVAAAFLADARRRRVAAAFVADARRRPVESARSVPVLPVFFPVFAVFLI